MGFYWYNICGYINKGVEEIMKKKLSISKIILGLALAGLSLSSLGACVKPEEKTELRESEDLGETDVLTETESENPFALEEEASAAYKDVLKDPEAIVFRSEPEFYDEMNGYSYALVSMDPETLPILVVRKTLDYMEHLAFFAYDPEKEGLVEFEEPLAAGMASAGGFSAGLYASKYGKGLIYNEFHRTTGDITNQRLSFQDGAFKLELLEEYSITDTDFDSIAVKERAEVNWFELDDLSHLDMLAQGELILTDMISPYVAEVESEEEIPEESPQEDLYAGTFMILTDEELCQVQGISNPNPWNPPANNAVFVLDQVTTITGDRADGESGAVHDARIFALGNDSYEDYVSPWVQYDGKHHKIRVESFSLPSDSSLPLGEPFAIGVEVVE